MLQGLDSSSHASRFREKAAECIIFVFSHGFLEMITKENNDDKTLTNLANQCICFRRTFFELKITEKYTTYFYYYYFLFLCFKKNYRIILVVSLVTHPLVGSRGMGSF